MDKDDLSRALIALYELISRLRGPDGCPWDARQTDSSIKMYLLEEAYEVLDSIERGSPDDVCQELGDLLFQILFLAGLAEERREFDLKDVMERIREKMINRHPHVFGTVQVNGPGQVAENWAEIKKKEKGAPETLSSLLQSIPTNLPALLRAHRLSERASSMGIDRPNPEDIWGRVEEKFEGLRKTILEGDKKRAGEKIGDLLFNLVELARDMGLNAEHLLRHINQEFIEQLPDYLRG